MPDWTGARAAASVRQVIVGGDGIFLSYRRRTSWHVATLIRDRLVARRLDVFMDVESIKSGAFESVIEREISRRRNFVVILDSALRFETAASSETDWLVKEISSAIRSNRNIVPVMANGFSFTRTRLPATIRALAGYNAVPIYPEYPESAVDKIVEFVGGPSGPGARGVGQGSTTAYDASLRTTILPGYRMLGLQVGVATKADVHHVLGQPNSTSGAHNDYYFGLGLEANYHESGIVRSLTAFSGLSQRDRNFTAFPAEYRTPEGISMRSSRADVARAYGGSSDYSNLGKPGPLPRDRTDGVLRPCRHPAQGAGLIRS